MPPPDETVDGVGSGLSARRVRAGGDVCLLAVGKMLAAASAAADALAAEGIDASVWDVRVAHPLDDEMLADAAGHPAVVTVEDGYREGGIGAAIAARLAERAVPMPPIRVLGVPVRFIPHGKPDAILADLGLDAAGVAASTRDLLAGRSAG
jgi:1-deoxy-D-xylulose-5-phosphate synthase